jgi:hypothetical protein
MTYKPVFGQIRRFEAALIYRAVKEGKIRAIPEFTKDLYRQTEDSVEFSAQRYSQDYISYDRIYSATKNILEGNYKAAQKEIDDYIKDRIERAGKRSIYYRYK